MGDRPSIYQKSGTEEWNKQWHIMISVLITHACFKKSLPINVYSEYGDRSIKDLGFIPVQQTPPIK